MPEILRSKVAVLVELHCQRRELQKLNRSLARRTRSWSRRTPRCRPRRRASWSAERTCSRRTPSWSTSNDALQAEIAERARAEAALKEADRHKDEFLAMLAHELRNPLAPIRNAVDIMSRMPLDDPQLRWSRDVIERQATHLTRLVDDLLDVSRITRGKIKLSAGAGAQSSTIVARAIETAQPMIAEQRHELSIDCPRRLADGARAISRA